MAQYQDFSCKSGDTWSKTFYFRDKHSNAEIDITGWTVFFTAKQKITDLDVAAKISKTIITHTDPTHGETVISLTATDTNRVETLVYDMKFITDSGDTKTFLEGDFNFLKNITIRTS